MLAALLLDGGGLGGGVPAEVKQTERVGAGAQLSSPRHLGAHTTIPRPSSIEEEGGSKDVGQGAECRSALDFRLAVRQPRFHVAIITALGIRHREQKTFRAVEKPRTQYIGAQKRGESVTDAGHERNPTT